MIEMTISFEINEINSAYAATGSVNESLYNWIMTNMEINGLIFFNSRLTKAKPRPKTNPISPTPNCPSQ